MRWRRGKAEEGVTGGTGPGERCFPNGSRLTLVCGRVEGNPESSLSLFLFLLFFSLSSRFLIPCLLDAARGGYGDPVRSAPSASCPLSRVPMATVVAAIVIVLVVADGMCGYDPPFFFFYFSLFLSLLVPSSISPACSQPSSNCGLRVIYARLPRFGGRGSFPRTRSFSQSPR